MAVFHFSLLSGTAMMISNRSEHVKGELRLRCYGAQNNAERPRSDDQSRCYIFFIFSHHRSSPDAFYLAVLSFLSVKKCKDLIDEESVSEGALSFPVAMLYDSHLRSTIPPNAVFIVF